MRARYPANKKRKRGGAPELDIQHHEPWLDEDLILARRSIVSASSRIKIRIMNFG
jgi:hypothetical protein